jgi:diacylglycerol kinase (ATP)
MKRAIDVIINRNAGRLAKGSALRDAIVAAAHGGGARVYETRNLDDLAAAAREIASRGTDGVVLAGGDGSAMAGLSALDRAHPAAGIPPVAFVAAGSVCTISHNLGGRGDPKSWMERAICAACRGTARAHRRPTLRVRDDAGGDRVGFIFGTGLVSRFFEIYDAAPRRGLAAAARIAGRIFVGSFVGSPLARHVLNPAPYTIAVDGMTHPARTWSLVLASVLRDVGLHLVVTYRAGEELERFHVVASGVRPLALGPQLPRVLAGRPLVGKPRVDALARSLSVSFGVAGDAYVLDGEVIRAHAACIDAGPAIQVLSPV